MFEYIGLIGIIYIGYRLYRYLYPPPNVASKGKYVLISGCDTGFGESLAVELDQHGFNILAGVYLEDNIEQLKKQLSKRAVIFKLDVTKSEDIESCFKLIQSKTPCLHALVNNAGIGKGGLIDWISMNFYRRMMDVNFFGHVQMTKTFLPLLVNQPGSRVVNITSAAGMYLRIFQFNIDDE
ncbi:unnamed protein product [Didymodactylos carnosus]|uniref:Uncharacterized protein n=1 Tax=Didymodactylos carnosus TaxID=1234261 RepID=A0A815Y6N7_9BILA|nr:unnamed protein product [Didymodactylos carnosus]CAF4429074.1 unnamed protein product [Didymodactylos carnosus]